MSFWSRKKVLVTGGAGFIGSHVVEKLVKSGAVVTVADRFGRNAKRNLASVWGHFRRTKGSLASVEACRKAAAGQDVVLHLAAKVAGVGYNIGHHATMFRENMQLSMNMLEASRRAGVGRYLVVSSACVYPRDCKVPTPESEGFVDVPEPTNAGYGWSKRMAEFMGAAYRDEYGMDVVVARPYNAYGPRDHFDAEKSHVVAALIKRVCDGEDPIVVWGNGKPSRAFLYVDDFARGLLLVAEKAKDARPINLGSSEEVTVAELIKKIVRISGSDAKVTFDPSKPMGQPRRNCDSTLARKTLGFKAAVALDEGLERTIDWYREHEA